MTRLYTYGVLFIVLLLNGCKTQNYPICQKLADTTPTVLRGINKTLWDVCAERNITITILSSNIAQFRGRVKDMRWLQQNYHILVCDFDQSKLPKSYIVSCLVHSPAWISKVNSTNPEELLLDDLHYCPICILNGECH